MDALRNSKKISLLAVAILFLFTFFNLILMHLVKKSPTLCLLCAWTPLKDPTLTR
jgi:hypothetical protein